MDKKPWPQSFWMRLLTRVGGLYPVVVTALVQLISFVGAALAAVFIQLNAELLPRQFNQASVATAILVLVSNLALLASVSIITKEARHRLDKWMRGEPLSPGAGEEIKAWRQISSLAWWYGAAALAASAFLVILPLLLYAYYVLDFTQDQVIYTIIGGAISALALIALAIPLLEILLRPAHEILLPASFEGQIAGVTRFRLLWKYMLITMALIVIAVLLVAPIGYHQTVTVLYKEIGSAQVLKDLQSQSILVTILALGLGLGLAYVLSRSISDPLNQLIQVFNKVEQVDLSQRARVLTMDETGELTLYFNRMLARLQELQVGLEQQVERRTAQLRATNEVGSVASSILDPDELVSRVVNLITDQFGYYYAAIFLLDPSRKWAELQDATGEAGRVLRENRHRLQVGGKSMVGTAIASRQPRVALDVGSEKVRFENPLLPYTRSEIALPLIVGERVLGALDVQSTQQAAFGPQEIETLQGMANQVAIALENARLFQETQQSLVEMRTVQRQYLLKSWKNVSEQEKMEYGIGEVDSSEKIAELDIPLALRDQIIGQITLAGEGEWTPEQRSLIEAVATQAALALENARLIEESQTAAAHDHLIAEITAKLWASPTVDSILQTAIQELGRALEASETTIELKVE